MPTQFAEITRQLRAEGKSYAEAAREARAQMGLDKTTLGGASNPTASPSSTPTGNPVISASMPIPETPVRKLGGGAIATNGLVTDVSGTYNLATGQNISPSSSSTSTPTTTSGTPTSTPSITGGSSSSSSTSGKGSISSPNVVEGQTNKVASDAMKRYDENKQIDATQYENQRLAIEAYGMEKDTEYKKYKAEREYLALEEDRIQKESAAKEAQNLQALQEKERLLQEAAVAEAQTKAEAQEREVAIANDIELQKSNVAFAKLGLSLSTAAVTQAQQIYTTGIYKLAELKASNAFKVAGLKLDVAKTEFEHTKAINDIIKTSQEKSFQIRKTLLDDVHKIQNSIIDNRLTRQENLDKALDNYQKALSDNEQETLKSIESASNTLISVTEGIYKRLKLKEEYSNEKIDTLVLSGKWSAMTPKARIQYEKDAGLPVGTMDRKIRAVAAQKLMKQAQEITGLKGVTFDSRTYYQMLNAVMFNFTELAVPLDEAINLALAENLQNSPEYALSMQKQQADIRKKTSGGGGGAKISKPQYTYQDIVNEETGKTERVEVEKGKGITRTLGVSGNKINVNQQGKTFVDSLKAAFAEKKKANN